MPTTLLPLPRPLSVHPFASEGDLVVGMTIEKRIKNGDKKSETIRTGI
ncbi:MAG: hypothetical protein LBB23_01265 [Rickettsiales bacterium]|jgi:hypothetical protein|nr:hypothetical protein [Rickettsiales bacterium]